LSNEQITINSKQPLTYEQIWGEPEQLKIDNRKSSMNYCPYKKIRCYAWDHGCQAEVCIVEDEK